MKTPSARKKPFNKKAIQGRYGGFGKNKGWIAAILLSIFGLANICKASDTVFPGWDLFETVPPTDFMGVPFMGVPIVSYDFDGGGPNPAVNVGNTDTIVHRLNPASAPSTAISTEMVALQLVSSAPTDFGLGVGLYYITLQSMRGGPASTGRMTINFDAGGEVIPHGTFDSFFDVFFDIRLGSLSGPIAVSGDLDLTANNVPWVHDPPLGAFLLNGTNYFVNGSNRDNDFFPFQGVTEAHPTGSQHSVVTTRNVPEIVNTLLGLAVGFSGIAMIRRKYRP